MKKNFTLSLVVVSLLTFVLGIAASEPQETKKVSLTGMRYGQNSLVVQFKLTGFHKLSEVQGSVIVNEQFSPLKCVVVNGGAKHIRTIRCKAESMNKYAGQPARIWLSGFVFYTKVPGKK